MQEERARVEDDHVVRHQIQALRQQVGGQSEQAANLLTQRFSVVRLRFGPLYVHSDGFCNDKWGPT